jgi:hypothetical protein
MRLMRGREEPAVALLISPVPAGRLSCVSVWALAVGEWSPPALSMAAGRGGGSPIQRGAASPAAVIRAKPATVAAAHAGLCRSADAIGHR